MVAVELAMEMYVAGYDVAAFWDNGDGGDGGHEADIFFLTHDSIIFRQSFNPVGGFSMMEQVRFCTVCPVENWLGTSKTTYRV